LNWKITMTSTGPNLRCRFYEQIYPEVDDLVVVNVRSIAAMGAYVSLLEYNDIEGMILLSELSRRRIRSINKLIRVGRNETVVVLRVDKEKGYIDLSKRRVAAEDVGLIDEKYSRARTVHSIMRHVAQVTGHDLLFLMEKIAWPLARRTGDPTPWDCFKLAITNPEEAFGDLEFPSEEVKEQLIIGIRRRLAPQQMRLRADVELTCFTYDGINALKEALRAGLACSTEEYPIKIKLEATPVYNVTTVALNKQEGIDALNAAIDAIRISILEKKGSLVVQKEPHAVSDRDDASTGTTEDGEGDN